MNVTVNGEPRTVADDSTLSALILQLDLKPERLAVEHNGEVVPRARWSEARLAEGDRIEIVHFVGGG